MLTPVPPLDRATRHSHALDAAAPDTASVLQVRGDVLFLLGDSAGAQKLWSTALEMAERRLGPNHPSIAEFLRRLGFAEFSAGRPRRGAPSARARGARRRSRARALRSCGDQAPQWLAESLRYDGDYFEARRLYGRALTTIEKCLGKHALGLRDLRLQRRRAGARDRRSRRGRRALRPRAADLDEGARPRPCLCRARAGRAGGSRGDARTARTFARAVRARAGHPSPAAGPESPAGRVDADQPGEDRRRRGLR